MLTPQEEDFLVYWADNRTRKKRILWQLAAGLPLAVVIAASIFVNYFSGWYRRADMQISVDSSGVLVVLVALVGIVIFIVVFSAKHRWEMNEQRYKELLFKKGK